MTQFLISSPKGGFITTAKHYGDGVNNRYEAGTEDPTGWYGLIPAPGGASDTYLEMTLVFSIYPLELSDAGNWYIFGSESGNIIIAHYNADGGLWIGGRDSSNATKSANTVGDGLGDWAGMTPYEWNSIMIAFQTISGERRLKMKSNGVLVYDGLLGTGDNPMNPHAYDGFVWGGRGDGFSGPAERGMESYVSYIWCDETYLDPDVYYDDFFDANYKPKNIGANGSVVTGSQPQTYAPDGDLANHVGLAATWGEFGTVPDAPISPTD